MPKVSLNIDDPLLAWLDAEAKAAKRTRTDVVVALVKAAMAAEKEPPETTEIATDRPQTVSPLSAPLQTDMAPMRVILDMFLQITSLLATLDLFFQRYITDHPDPNIDLSPDERWERIVKTRDKMAAEKVQPC